MIVENVNFLASKFFGKRLCKGLRPAGIWDMGVGN